MVDSSVEPPQLDVLNSESNSVSAYRNTTSSSAHVKRGPRHGYVACRYGG
ncbi:hypothetical protein NC652_033758 [Populus alba x Populus x berolinensis]|uniref:Uncharacterized protein n=1 Tax=Populus alba x Populus x berolinensis TaxID=444605 RepID=A0AAD6LUK0_9ROSI|nr:hypothetical protein NC652_033758 [Populus alba x Populus x berolinensis]KAJ6973426.1 hypothetical protein NC653_033684 [Populus alba x Populus x berolinensis]